MPTLTKTQSLLMDRLKAAKRNAWVHIEPSLWRTAQALHRKRLIDLNNFSGVDAARAHPDGFFAKLRCNWNDTIQMLVQQSKPDTDGPLEMPVEIKTGNSPPVQARISFDDPDVADRQREARLAALRTMKNNLRHAFRPGIEDRISQIEATLDDLITFLMDQEIVDIS